MKRLAVVALAGMALASGVQQAMAVTLTESVDRFSGVKTVSWTPLPPGPGKFSLTSAIFSVDDQSRLVIDLLTYADKRQYGSCNYVFWLVDGKPINGIDTEYSADSAESTVIERFKLKPTDAALKTLAAAHKVEFKVCNTEDVVSDNDLDGFKAVYAKTLE